MCGKSWYIIEVNPVQARLPIKNAIYSSRSSRSVKKETLWAQENQKLLNLLWIRRAD